MSNLATAPREHDTVLEILDAAAEVPRVDVRPSPGPGNLRNHLTRSAIRLGVLLVADATALIVGRGVLRSFREGALGAGVAGAVADLFPDSAVYGPQLFVALVICLTVVGGYRTGDHWRAPARTLAAVGMSTILTLYGDLWHGEPLVVLGRGMAIWVLMGLALVFARIALNALAHRVPRAGLERRVLEIRGEDGPTFGTEMGAGFRTVAVLRPEDLPRDLERMEDWLEGGVDTILVSGHLPAERFTALTDFALAHGCRLLTQPRSNELVGVDPRRVWIGGQAFFELTAPGLRASQLLLKRGLDVVGSVALLLILSPLMLLVALAVKLESPGPVLFRQRRAGMGGRFFELTKFRSMRADAEEALRRDPMLYRRYVENDFKLPEHEDPRVTRLGRFLRKTSLDELPQLLNVLKGEMSLVGPRPVVEPELQMYRGRVPTFLSVRPGLTGLWQISGRSTVAFPERAEMDLDYIRGWSLLEDLWILFMTVPAVIIRKGAH